jgi:hypothetical protein
MYASCDRTGVERLLYCVCVDFAVGRGGGNDGGLYCFYSSELVVVVPLQATFVRLYCTG